MGYLEDIKNHSRRESHEEESGLSNVVQDVANLEISKLSVTGGTLTGELNLVAGDPSSDTAAASKKYVDDSVGNAGGGDMLKTVYDNEGINTQVVGVDSTQSITNKTVNGVLLTASGSSTKYLNESGSYVSIAAGGDMNSSTYDPNNVSADAFNVDNHIDGTSNKVYTAAEQTKLSGIEPNAEANNLTDANATDLTDGGTSSLHYHPTDRLRSNHTGTQDVSTITGLSSVSTSGDYDDLINKPTTISAAQASDIATNNAKVSNVDHPLVQTAVPLGAVFTDTIYDDTAIQAEVDLNTAKVGVTAQMISDVATNTLKVGITPQQASDIVTNNSKVGVTAQLISDVNTNTLKVGITPQQASDITSNNAKVSNINHPLVETAVPLGAVFTDTIYDDSDVIKDSDTLSPVTGTNKVMTEIDVAGLGGGDMLSSTYDPIINANTAKVGITPQQASDITANNAKVGITSAQASDIIDNNAKISYTDSALVSTHTSQISDLTTDKVDASGDTMTGALILHTNLPTSNEEAASKKYVDDSVGNAGGGDMLKSVYDTDNDGIVDNAEKLNSKSPGFYLNYNNFTNKPTTITAQQASDIATNNGKISYTDSAAVAANTAKVGITTQQANDIISNNAKVGITTAQSNAIVANTSKISYTDAATVNALSIQVSSLSLVAYSGSYNDLTNKPTIPPTAPVDSVNSQTGVVVLTSDDIDDSADAHKFVSAAERQQISDNLSSIANLSVDVNANSSDIQSNGANIASNTAAIITNATNISNLNGSNIPTSSGGSTSITDALNQLDIDVLNAVKRQNHTGTQLASTISDFAAASNRVIGGSQTISDNHYVSEIENNSILIHDSGDDYNLILDSNSGTAVEVGFKCTLVQANSGLVVFNAGAGATIISINSAIETAGQGSMVHIAKIGTNTWNISGDLA